MPPKRPPGGLWPPLGRRTGPRDPPAAPATPLDLDFCSHVGILLEHQKSFRGSEKHSKNKLLGEGVFCSISDPWGGHVGSMLGGFWKVFGRFCQVLFSSVALLRSAVKKYRKNNFSCLGASDFRIWEKSPKTPKNRLFVAFCYKIHSKTESCRQGGPKGVFETPGKRISRGSWRHVEA